MFAVIGAGIVGLATAYEIRRVRPDAEIWVLEKEVEPALHQTGRNSGVIHSGLYYKPGSAKAVNCRKGRARLLEFCRQHGIEHELCGKVVLATKEDEIPALEELHRRGLENGVSCRFLREGELADYEPHAVAVRALHVEDSGIVDYREVCRTLLQASGCKLVTGAKVLQVVSEGARRRVVTTQGEFVVDYVVNCGGLQSDRVCALTGVNPPLRIVPFKGEYYRLKDSAAHLCRHLIYPVPDPNFPFLGVHLTRRIGGGVDAGPNAVLALGREAYLSGDMNLSDLLETLSYSGFWRLSLKHWTMGLGEMVRSASKTLFTKALQRLCPEIQKDDLVVSAAGIRAQAVRPDGSLEDDFQVLTEPGLTNVLNAPSPAATASLAIGEEIVARMDV